MEPTGRDAALSMQDWKNDVPITKAVHLPPAPRFFDAIGHNYEFETAVADLVDNSLDAGARTILARFITTSGVPTGFALIDDGNGIAPDQIESAMTLGGSSDYGQNSLGYFGIGLKASSFSQANTLMLLSRESSGQETGMRWVAEKARSDFECDVIDEGYVGKMFVASVGGRLVDQRNCGALDRHEDFPCDRRIPRSVYPFLQKTSERLVGHLGLVFHRIIAKGLRILVDVEESTTRSDGIPWSQVYGHRPRGACAKRGQRLSGDARPQPTT